MQFIDTITIFNKVDKEYKKYTLSGVYWYGSKNISISGHGVVHNDEISIFIPKDKMSNYKESYQEGYFTLRKGDRIVKGSANDDITSVNELSQYSNAITITSFDVNEVGSNLDNILIRGK